MVSSDQLLCFWPSALSRVLGLALPVTTTHGPHGRSPGPVPRPQHVRSALCSPSDPCAGVFPVRHPAIHSFTRRTSLSRCYEPGMGQGPGTQQRPGHRPDGSSDITSSFHALNQVMTGHLSPQTCHAGHFHSLRASHSALPCSRPYPLP